MIHDLNTPHARGAKLSMVVVQGQWIHQRYARHTLAQQTLNAKEIAVFGVPDPDWGQRRSSHG